MKIGVTGASGFVGGYLLERLSLSHQLKCWARSGQPDTSKNVEWINGSLNDPESTRELVRGCDAVVHSGLARTSASFRGREASLVEYLDTNLIGTIRLIESAIEAGVQRFVFVSTCAVHEVILDDRPLDETHPVWPLTHYGAHKAAIEKFVHSYGWGSENKEFSICAVRPTGIYGIHRDLEQSKWYSLVKEIIEGRDVEVSGGGKEVHAADVAKAIELLLQTENISGEVFNCYDRYISQHDVANLAKQFASSNSRIEGQPTSPKHQIETGKLRRLGMQFGGTALLQETIRQLVEQLNSGSQ